MDGMICRLCGSILYNMLFTLWPCASLHSTHGSHRLDISVQLKHLRQICQKTIQNFSKATCHKILEGVKLEYFKPEFLSLAASPHPIFTTAGTNIYSITMASVQGIMLSDRFRTEVLISHWSENGSKHCIKDFETCDQGAVQSHLSLVTCTWCYCLSRDRLKVYGRWQRLNLSQ